MALYNPDNPEAPQNQVQQEADPQQGANPKQESWFQELWNTGRAAFGGFWQGLFGRRMNYEQWKRMMQRQSPQRQNWLQQNILNRFR